MKNLVKIVFMSIAFGMLVFSADSAMAQGRYGNYQRNRNENRREYRQDVRRARQEYREDIRDARRDRRNDNYRYNRNNVYNNSRRRAIYKNYPGVYNNRRYRRY